MGRRHTGFKSMHHLGYEHGFTTAVGSFQTGGPYSGPHHSMRWQNDHPIWWDAQFENMPGADANRGGLSCNQTGGGPDLPPNGLRDAMSEECEAAGTADECEALGSGLPAAAKPCQWEEPSTCRLNDRWGEDGSSQDWLQFTMYALFGLAIGQLIRLASSHIFRKATRDQVTHSLSLKICTKKTQRLTKEFQHMLPVGGRRRLPRPLLGEFIV